MKQLCKKMTGNESESTHLKMIKISMII